MKTLWQDIRQGARILMHRPAFTAVAVLALALGIGPNTAIFSVVNTLLLTPPPYQDPDTIVRVAQTRQGPGGTPMKASLSTDDFQSWRESTQTLEYMAISAQDTLTLTGVDEPVRLTGARVSPALFPLLRVQPYFGQIFPADAERPGNDRWVLLSYATWVSRFGSDRAIAGKSIKLDGNDYTVSGVMPAGFAFPNRDTQYWVPMTLTPPQRGGNERRIMMVPAIARMKPGVTPAQVIEEGQNILEGNQRVDPRRDPEARKAQLQVTTLQEEVVAPVRPALQVLLVAVGFVLLIACANVANLLLTRAAGRSREIALRAALGAGRMRIVRQMLTESVMLSLLAGAMGLLLGYWCLTLLPKVSPADIAGLADVRIDARVLGFTLALSLATGLLFGLAPALKSVRGDLMQPLKEGGVQAVSGFQFFRHNKTRSLLTVAEFSLALMLMVGAGLLTRSFLLLIRQDPGYDPRGVLTLQVSLPRARYPQPGLHGAFYDQLLPALRALPGVQSAGITNLMPLTPAAVRLTFQIPGRPPASDPDEQPVSGVRLVSPGYFAAMATRMIDGRDFTEQDREGSVPVVIVNEAFARRYFPGEEVVGRRIGMGTEREIVGLTGDVKPQGLDSEALPEMFLPYQQFGQMLLMGGPLAAMNVVVRTSGDPLALVPVIRTKVAALDPQLPLFNVATMEQRVSASVARPRFFATLLGVFAGLALVLAAIGIYGVLSYHVAQCTREIGIRMSLGARRGDVLRLVMRQGLMLGGIGTLLGLAGAWATTRFLSSMLFGITPTDLSTYAGIVSMMAIVGFLATYIPARRATAIDPVIALRCE